jgi:hypothetical protein
MIGGLRNDLRHVGHFRSGRLRALGVGVFRLAHELIRLFLRHLSAADHVLHEVARTLDGEGNTAGGRTDDVLHGRRDLTPGFLTDLLRAGRHFGDSIADVGAAMSGGATGRDRSGRRSWIDGSGRFGGQRLVSHGGSHSECANVEGQRRPTSICSVGYGADAYRNGISEGKYMILR